MPETRSALQLRYRRPRRLGRARYLKTYCIVVTAATCAIMTFDVKGIAVLVSPTAHSSCLWLQNSSHKNTITLELHICKLRVNVIWKFAEIKFVERRTVTFVRHDLQV
eukprot:1588118-Pleurochrysis_carterae.AAC.2